MLAGTTPANRSKLPQVERVWEVLARIGVHWRGFMPNGASDMSFALMQERESLGPPRPAARTQLLVTL